MSDYSLTAAPVLGGFKETFGDTTIEEVTGLSIVSISAPRGGEDALNAAMKSAYGTDFPQTGKSTRSSDGAVQFLGMGPDQAFAIFDNAADDGDQIVAAKLGDAGYYTFQSDNWVVLRLSGGHAREALQRTCQIDIHPDVFLPGTVARTVMEHMGSTIVAEEGDSFLLLSAWSTAGSFLHAIETSVKFVV